MEPGRLANASDTFELSSDGRDPAPDVCATGREAREHIKQRRWQYHMPHGSRNERRCCRVRFDCPRGARQQRARLHVAASADHHGWSGSGLCANTCSSLAIEMYAWK